MQGQHAHGGAAAAGGGEGDDPPWRQLTRNFHRFVNSTIVHGENLAQPLAGEDLESEGGQPQWSSWARSAMGRVRDQAAQAAEQAQHGLAQVSDGGGFSRGLSNVAQSAAGFQESLSNNVGEGQWKDHAGRFQDTFKGGFDNAASAASVAGGAFQENASAAAGASRRAMSVAHERVSGAAQLAMDPVRLMKSAGIFMLGVFFVMISLNFLPTLLLKPANFALFFTVGSVTMLSSFAYLHGPEAFWAQLTSESKRPFSAAYAGGLLGTLAATVVMRSYWLTAIFALLQAVALLYLVFSYLPGGTSFLNLIGRAGSRSARSVVLGG